MDSPLDQRSAGSSARRRSLRLHASLWAFGRRRSWCRHGRPSCVADATATPRLPEPGKHQHQSPVRSAPGAGTQSTGLRRNARLARRRTIRTSLADERRSRSDRVRLARPGAAHSDETLRSHRTTRAPCSAHCVSPLAPLTTSPRCSDAGAFSATPLTPSLPLAPIVPVGLTTRYRLLRRSRCSAGSALPLRYVAPARLKGGRPTGSYEAHPFRSSYLRPTSVEALPTVCGWSEGHLARPCSTDSHSARDAPESLLRLLRARSSPHWFARSLARPLLRRSRFLRHSALSLVPLPPTLTLSPVAPGLARSARSSSILRTSLSSVAEFLGVSSLVRQHAGGNRRRTRLASETCGLGDAFPNRVKPLRLLTHSLALCA